MSLRLGALSLIVPDYDAAIAWFRDALGWSCQEDVAMGDKRWVRVVSPCGGASVILARAATPEQHEAIGQQGAGRVWLFLETQDFTAQHHRMQAAGVMFEQAPHHEPYGVVAVFRDPWGNRWDLVQPA